MRKLRIPALLLALVMLFTVLTACNKTEKPTTTTTPSASNPGADTQPTDSVEDDGTYTYNTAMTLSPTNWNPHTYKTTTDGDAYDYISNALYEFSYNEDYSGYEIVPVMASADPVDVTDQYVGEDWGIAEGETGKAFRIALNPDACWQDGTPINADTYIYSLEELLNPELQNSRASDYYQSSLAIHNAKGYVYSGTSVYEPAYNFDTATALYAEGDTLYLDVSNISALASIFGDADMNALVESGYGDYFIAGELDFATKYAEATGDARIEATDEVIADIKTLMTEGPLAAYWGWADEEIGGFLVHESVYPTVSFDQVGIKKIDDYTFDLILDKELVGFYIKYNLNVNWIVYKDLYEACKTQDATTGSWSSTYGTTVETTMSYGPYKLTGYFIDQSMTWERNDNWFGYTDKYADTYGTFTREIDGSTCEQYQTDKIVWTMASDISTREEMFLKGQLDALGLNADLLTTYSSSDVLYFTEGETTFYGIINSDYPMLLSSENILNGGSAESDPASCPTPFKYNKTILAVKEFRQALCYALDRTALCAALYPAGTAAFSLFSNLVMADPLNSVSVNSLESIKAAVCEFWGVTYGEGGEFATLDDAYDAITGYDIDQARTLIDQAVDTAITNGWMTSDSIVKITYCAASSSDTETKWYNFFKQMFTDLMVGTKLEGKFEYDSDFTLGNEFGDKIQDGQCDTAWGFGWSGGTLDPYDLFQVYVDGTMSDSPYQYDKWIDWSAVDLTINLDAGEGAKDYTYSVVNWWQIINGVDNNNEGLPNWAFGKVADSVRAEVLAQLEKNVLLNYTTIPLMNQGAVQLKSYKVNFGREEYIYGVGRGGVRYMTYNYNDADWATYCASQADGILTY